MMIYKYALLFTNILKSFKNRISKNALSREAELWITIIGKGDILKYSSCCIKWINGIYFSEWNECLESRQW